MEEFKKYLKNKIYELDKEIDHILDIDIKRKKIYKKEVCIMFSELINEYETKTKENDNNERKTNK